jgi:hypothetical protein
VTQVVNQLLGRGDEEVAFRFVVKERFLRGSLKSHMAAHGLQNEKTLVLKYELNPLKPKLTKTQEQEDWIMSIEFETKEFFYVSLCNGGVNVFDRQTKMVGTNSLANEIVKTATISDV